MDFPAGDAFGGDFGETRGPALQGFSCASAEKGVSVVRFDGGVHEGAAAGDEAFAFSDEVVDHFFEAKDGVGNVVDAREAAGDGLFPGVVEGLAGESLLAREMAVDAAFLQAGGLQQVGEGSAFLALAIEQGAALRTISRWVSSPLDISLDMPERLLRPVLGPFGLFYSL